jgi:transcriptional regulator NrdR family protein
MAGKRPFDLSTPCPYCGVTEGNVVDVRKAAHGQIRRRRECSAGHRYTTYENVEHPDSNMAEGFLP